MKIRTTVKLNLSVIKKIEQDLLRTLEMTAEATLTDITSTSAVVPKHIGTLERGGFAKAKGGKEISVKGGHVDKSKIMQGKAFILFDGPYARRLYWHPEYNFSTDMNRNAQGNWMESYVNGSKKNWVRDKFIEMQRKHGNLK